jgi:hypothetical protein
MVSISSLPRGAKVLQSLVGVLVLPPEIVAKGRRRGGPFNGLAESSIKIKRLKETKRGRGDKASHGVSCGDGDGGTVTVTIASLR